MSTAPRPRRYVLRAAGFFAIAVAGITMGTVASAHHMDVLNGLAVGIVGITLGLGLATLGTAYRSEVRIPRQARLLTAMSQAMDGGQAVSGKFRAGLRDLASGAPSTRWKHGRVKITPQSVAWAPLVGRTRPHWRSVHRRAPDRPDLHRDHAPPPLLLQGRERPRRVTVTGTLHSALHSPWSPALRLLPGRVEALLEELQAPPRLAAHLRVVHDVAWQLADWADARYPALGYDRDAMLFGAATHDIGKAVFPAELTGPGSAHEEAGRRLLLSHGVSPALARFAATHASWGSPGAGMEDLMVSVADKAWKYKRVTNLEDLLVTRLAKASGQDAWQEFAGLDTFLEAIGDRANDRLAFQASFPAAPA